MRKVSCGSCRKAKRSSKSNAKPRMARGLQGCKAHAKTSHARRSQASPSRGGGVGGDWDGGVVVNIPHNIFPTFKLVCHNNSNSKLLSC